MTRTTYCYRSSISVGDNPAVTEDANGMRFVVDVGSLTKDQLQVYTRGDFLCVDGSSDTCSMNNRYGISSGLRDAPITATLKDGLLTITVGDAPPDQPRRAVQIQTE